ncbi:MAG: exodeoxyribonuclease VII large subunit [Desulfobacteraceae bacterium]
MIYTVSGLTRELKELIEESYPFVWISGEISNFFTPASGHCYFSLKDSKAVISGVMFKNQKRRLKFDLENGMKITGMGRLSLYEPRGSYQIIFEHMEPEGTGSLQAAFEQLKKKLSAQGFFDEKHKQKIPFLPSRISVITSGTGAAVRDIITVSQRRCPGVQLEILPVTVQGRDAEFEVAAALGLVNAMGRSDLAIVARGGGSLEDLTAFNSETVARAVFDSAVPVISAVGHETDFTICDFTADLRAPTPSAAAELALPDKKSLEKNLAVLNLGLARGLTKTITRLRERIFDLQSRLKSPTRIVDDMRFRLEDLEERLAGQMAKIIALGKERLDWFSNALYAVNPGNGLVRLNQDRDNLTNRLEMAMEAVLRQCRAESSGLQSRLEALSPAAVLERGYSITRECRSKKVLTDAETSKKGDMVEVLLARGNLLCQVEKSDGSKKDV